MKYHYAVYSTKEATYIQPTGRTVPKSAIHQWTIDCEYKLCTKRLKLQGHISSIDQIAELLQAMVLDIREM